jgi:hypothetical protein
MRKPRCLLALLVTLGSIGAVQPGAEMSDGSFPILFAIDLAVPLAKAVGHDGTDFWVASADNGSGHCHFYIVDEYGEFVTSVPQGGGAGGWGCRDLAFDGTNMFGSHGALVDGYDSDYEYVGSFGGCLSLHRSLAYVKDRFYTSAFAQSLYRMTWNGVWGTSAICQDLGCWIDGALGITYDGVLNGLWVTTGATANNLHRMPLGGGSVEAFTTRPEYETALGCTMAYTRFGYVLVVLVAANPTALVFYDVGYSSTTGRSSVASAPALELHVAPSVLPAGGGEARIAFQLPSGPGQEWIHLTIFDAVGRIVAAMPMRVPGTRRGWFAWDGRAADGCPQPSGIYLIRAQTASLAGQGRLLILR